MSEFSAHARCDLIAISQVRAAAPELNEVEVPVLSEVEALVLSKVEALVLNKVEA
jgi:hypothetical protein